MRKALTTLSIFKKKLQKLPVSVPCELYRTCSQLTLDRFITCLVDKDLTVLIIAGHPEANELQQTWVNLQEEYSELIKSETLQHTNDINAEIIVLQNRLFRISLCVEALQYVYTKDLIDELKEHNMPFDYNPDMPEKYFEDLRMTVERTKGLNMKLKIKQGELEEWYKSNESRKVENTREQFEETLAALTESNGFLVDETKITVTQYVRLLNRYNAKIIAQAREIDKRNS